MASQGHPRHDRYLGTTVMIEGVAAQFRRLFRGRGDCYGSWEGRCVKERCTPETFVDHLTSGPPIGVYPTMNMGNGVAHSSWGCTDIDYTDDPTDAYTIHDVFQAVGVQSWIERTAKGYHVWVFLETLTPSEHVRNMFLAAHQVAGINPKEVNPKQTRLGPGDVGNYVRLPYPLALTSSCSTESNSTQPWNLSGRYMLNRTSGARLELMEFLSAVESTDSFLSVSKVAELAGYYLPPTPRQMELREPSGSVIDASRKLTPLGRVIWREGPLEGRDRSTTLQHLAYECAKASLDPSDAYEIVKDADVRWGKNYLERGDKGEEILLRLIETAYLTE